MIRRKKNNIAMAVERGDMSVPWGFLDFRCKKGHHIRKSIHEDNDQLGGGFWAFLVFCFNV